MNRPTFRPARSARSKLSLINNQNQKKALAFPRFSSAHELVLNMKPSESVHCMRPHVIETAAKWFVSAFCGKVMYAVKTNPEPAALKTIFAAGIKDFDVASLNEIALVAEQCPDATMHYMHPVKSRESIMFAYHKYNVRSFSLDSMEELAKILEMTGNAKDLTLYVRLAVANESAAYSLKGKFGIAADEAALLLQECRKYAEKLGICFHVGSQCMNPEDYRSAIESVRSVIEDAQVKIDAIDVGGGFPSAYPSLAPVALQEYMDVISDSLINSGFGDDYQIFCEPGRAIVAENGSVIVKVELRKGNSLYINDGVYGSLFDAGYPAFIYPTRAIRLDGGFSAQSLEFKFFGPTCDSLDTMNGPFTLPSDIKEGDWIEIGGLGAYSKSMRTNFNGFYSDKQAELMDSPMLSMYGL
ncbi:MAG: type III PLP-dependent enzyme [Pseudomonadota bacterium]